MSRNAYTAVSRRIERLTFDLQSGRGDARRILAQLRRLSAAARRFERTERDGGGL